MAKSLDELKEELARKYLGKAGIHGLGVSHSENAIRVYLEPDLAEEQQTILDSIESEAHPFKVLPVISNKPATS